MLYRIQYTRDEKYVIKGCLRGTMNMSPKDTKKAKEKMATNMSLENTYNSRDNEYISRRYNFEADNINMSLRDTYNARDEQ